MIPPERRRESRDDPPPFLGTWPRVYVFVVLYLAALIFLFGWFTRAYAP